MSKNQSLILYLTSFFLSILICKIYQKANKLNNINKMKKFIWLFSIISIPLFLATIRYGIGTDYFNYLYMYQDISNLSYINVFKYGIEIGYSILNKLVSQIFIDEIGLFGVTSFITLIFLIYSIDKYKDKISMIMALFIYYLSYYNLTYNGVRQLMALSIILFAYTYAVERNFMKYFLLIMLATSFHTSSIICLPLYFLYINEKNKLDIVKQVMLYLFILFSPIIMMICLRIASYIPIFNKYFTIYNFDFSNMGLGFLIYQLPVIVPVLFYKKNILRLNKGYSFYINILLLQIPFQTLAYFDKYMYRVAWYGSIVAILIVPITISSIKNKNEKRIVSLYYILWYLFMFLIVNGGSPDTVPYVSIFSK